MLIPTAENQKQLFLLFSQLISHSEIFLPRTGRQTVTRRTALFCCRANYSKCLLHKQSNHSQLEKIADWRQNAPAATRILQSQLQTENQLAPGTAALFCGGVASSASCLDWLTLSRDGQLTESIKGRCATRRKKWTSWQSGDLGPTYS